MSRPFFAPHPTWWEVAVAELQATGKPWPEELAFMDLCYWQDQQRLRERGLKGKKRPSRRRLARRWNRPNGAAIIRLLKAEDIWGDPRKTDYKKVHRSTDDPLPIQNRSTTDPPVIQPDNIEPVISGETDPLPIQNRSTTDPPVIQDRSHARVYTGTEHRTHTPDPKKKDPSRSYDRGGPGTMRDILSELIPPDCQLPGDGDLSFSDQADEFIDPRPAHEQPPEIPDSAVEPEGLLSNNPPARQQPSVPGTAAGSPLLSGQVAARNSQAPEEGHNIPLHPPSPPREPRGGTPVQKTVRAIWARLNEICGHAHEGPGSFEEHPLTDARGYMVERLLGPLGMNPVDVLQVVWWACTSGHESAAWHRSKDHGPDTWFKPDLAPKFLRLARQELGRGSTPWLPDEQRRAVRGAGGEQESRLFALPDDPLEIHAYLVEYQEEHGRLPFPLCPQGYAPEISGLARRALELAPYCLMQGEAARESWSDAWSRALGERMAG